MSIGSTGSGVTTARITGGTFAGGQGVDAPAPAFLLNGGAEVTISGGDFVAVPGGGAGVVFRGPTLDLLGTEFLLNGIAIAGLTADEPFVVTDRDASLTLTAVLLDGNTLTLGLDDDFNANGAGAAGRFFASDATLRLTLIPEPGTAALALAGLTLLARRRRVA